MRYNDHREIHHGRSRHGRMGGNRLYSDTLGNPSLQLHVKCNKRQPIKCTLILIEEEYVQSRTTAVWDSLEEAFMQGAGSCFCAYFPYAQALIGENLDIKRHYQYSCK